SNNVRDTTSNQTVTYPANDAAARRTASFRPGFIPGSHPVPRIPRSVTSPIETPEPRENIERRTSNFQRRSERGFALPFDVRRWMFDVGCSLTRPPAALSPIGRGRGEGAVHGEGAGVIPRHRLWLRPWRLLPVPTGALLV